MRTESLQNIYSKVDEFLSEVQHPVLSTATIAQLHNQTNTGGLMFTAAAATNHLTTVVSQTTDLVVPHQTRARLPHGPDN